MTDLFSFGGKLMRPASERLRFAAHNPPPVPSAIHRYMDNTRISDYRTCPRYYWIRHVKHWAPQYPSLALINGSCWHEAMNVIWAKAKDSTIPDMALLRQGYQAYCAEWVKSGLKDPDKMTVDEIAAISPRGPQVAKEILWNYILKRRKFIAEGEVLAIERPFAVPLLVREDGTVEVYYVGRLDKVFKHPQHGTILPEHKTTSWYATDGFFRQEWIDSFSPNSQVDGYLFSGNILYDGKIKGVWVDGALFHKKVFDGIKWLVIDRQFEMIDNWLQETFQWIGRIKHDSETFAEEGTLERAFAKNTGSCGNYGGCAYRDICRFVVDPSKLNEPPPGFVLNPWNPFDVLKLEQLELEPEDGKAVQGSDSGTPVEQRAPGVDDDSGSPQQSGQSAVYETVPPRLVQVFEDDTKPGTWYGMYSDGSRKEVLITDFDEWPEFDSLDDGNHTVSCPYQPEHLIGMPIGQHHCPYCGAMCVAGFHHPTDANVIEQGLDPYPYPKWLFFGDFEDEPVITLEQLLGEQRARTDTTPNESGQPSDQHQSPGQSG